MSTHIRPMVAADIPLLHQAFGIDQGWEGKSIELFTNYHQQQTAGQRQVLVAVQNDHITGYITLLPNSPHGPFAGQPIPTVQDFNVLIKHRGQGIGHALMDAVEALAQQTSPQISLAVGMYADYGTAQRMYVKRGYIPDGSGLWYKDQPLPPYAPCCNDDDLVLYFIKTL